VKVGRIPAGTEPSGTPTGKPLRVAHVVTRLSLGGADENTLFTVNGLDPARFRASLIVGRDSDPSMLARVAPHVRVVEIAELVHPISPLNDFRAFVRLWRHLRDERYHIVHTHMAKAGILGRFAGRAAGVPLVVHTAHGFVLQDYLSPPQYALYWALEKAATQATDWWISVGEDIRKTHVDFKFGTAETITIIHSGMNLRQFEAAADYPPARRRAIRESLGVPPEAPLVGKVARLEPVKGHRYFLDVAERLARRHPKAHFAGIGAGALLGELQDDASRRGLADRIHFCGYRHDIADVLSALDVVILTSLMEGLPRVLVQASAAGVPSVTFEVAGAHEIVQDGVSGYVVPSKDVERMAERVGSLLDDPARARAMGAAARTRVHEGWTVEKMVADIEAVYLDLTRRRRIG
jgi:glycosyltransferase involved in cell wall biosynthesis